MSVDKKKVVIVGSGIGGVGLAALLQSRGYQVTVVEKNNFVGGKCSSYDKDGFVVDAAFHMFSLGEKGPHGIITEKTGGDLKWIHHNPTATIRMGNSGTMQFGITPKKNMARMGSAFVKGSLRPSIINMLRTTLKNYGVRELIDTMIKIAKAGRDLHLLPRRHDPVRVPLQVHGRPAGSPDCWPPFYVSWSWFPTPRPVRVKCCGASSRLSPRVASGVPQGGVRELGGSFRRSFLRFDGELRLGTAVKRIIVDDGKARGVETGVGRSTQCRPGGLQRRHQADGGDGRGAELPDGVRGLRQGAQGVLRRADAQAGPRPQDLQPSAVDVHASTPGSTMGGVRLSGRARHCPRIRRSAMIIPSDYDPSTAHPGRCMVLAGGMGPSDTTPENIDYCTRSWAAWRSACTRYSPASRAT